jgi:hypothetical protein
MARFRHRPNIVDAQRLRWEIKLVDEHGREKIGKRGDYLIHGVGDQQYIVDADVFEASYEPVEDGDR